MQEDPEGVTADAVYFGMPFFVGTGNVAWEKKVVGFGLVGIR